MYNPTLEGGIAFNQPVQTPSVIGAVGSIFDALQGPKPDKVSSTDRKDEARRFYFEQWDKGKQMIDQGNVAQGRRVIESAYRGWVSVYGPGTDEEVDTSFQNTLGRSPNTTQYGTASNLQAIRQTPEYALNVEMVRAKNPDFDEFQIEEAATLETQRKMAVDGELARLKQDQKVTWAQAERTYQEGANVFANDVQNFLAVIKDDNIITPEEAQTFRDWYGSQKQKFNPPPGVSDDEYKPFFDNRVKSLDDAVNLTINGLLEGNFSADLNRTMSQIIDKAIVQGKLPPALRIQLAPNGDGEFGNALTILQSISDAGQFGERWTESISTAMGMNYEELLDWVTEFENKDASYLDKVNLTEFNALKDGDKVNSLKQDVLSLKSEDLGHTALALVNITEKVNGLGSRALTPQLLSETFNNNFFQKVEEVYQANPVVGQAVIARAQDALAAQETAIIVATDSIAAQHGFKLKRGANGKYDFFPDATLMSPVIQKELDQYFGGDWNAAFKARGMVMADDGSMMRPTAVSRALMAVDELRPNINKFNTVMQTRKRLDGIIPEGGIDFNQIENITPLSGTLSDPATGSMMPASLIQTESGGNWSAKNDVEGSGGKGHFGRGQFSIGRLNEAKAAGVIPRGMTPQEFMKSEDAQIAVENWHVSDILDFVDQKGFNSYIGQTINGVEVTRNGMVAVAHLGGKGGLEKFLTSGGKYNPADANGTSLTDYLATHGGNTITRGAIGTGSDQAPVMSPRPEPRPEGLRPEPQRAATEPLSTAEVSPMPETSVASQQGSQARSEGAVTTRPVADTDLQRFLDSLDGGSVQVFKSEESLSKAKANGTVKTGDQVILNGKVVEVQ